MPSGSVISLHRWPVKSMAGEDADALELFEHGVRGDRQRALVWRGGRRLTARAAPRMLAWSARSNGSVPILTAPGGREWHWGDEGLQEAISEDLGKEVELAEDPTLMPDLPDSVLVTFQPTLERLREELDVPVDLRRFRTNVHVAIDAEPFAELGWEGRALRVGEARFELLHPCVRCAMVIRDPETQEAWPQLLRHLHSDHSSIFGINARPLGDAVIHVGDPIEVT